MKALSVTAAFALVCATGAAFSSPAAANTVLNGGFEQGTFIGGPAGSQQVYPVDTALSNWTVGGGPITWYQNGFNLKQLPLAAHNGDFAVNLADGSVREASVRQTINLLPFQEYQLSFWVGNYSANNGPASVIATILDGTSNTIILAETATAPRTDQSSTWVHFTSNFIADGTSNTITLAENFPVGPVPSYVGLDDVSVTATPLPAALPLFATGLGALGLHGWRRRRKTRLTPAEASA
jgi:hypothetical protein